MIQTLLPSQSCCPCCANSLTKSTINPSFLYGFWQSRLISCHPARKLIMSGAVQSYPRFHICDTESKCNYQKSHSSKERISSGRRRRWRNWNFGYLIHEEKGNTFKSHNADDAYLILSLLTEEVSEDILDVRESCEERNGRSASIPQVEKTKKRAKVKNGSSKFKYQPVESGSREEDNRYREEERSKQERKK